MRKLMLVISIFAMIGILFAGNVVYVPENYNSLQEAIKKTPQNTTIVITNGYYEEDLKIARDITIKVQEENIGKVILSGKIEIFKESPDAKGNEVIFKGLVIHSFDKEAASNEPLVKIKGGRTNFYNCALLSNRDIIQIDDGNLELKNSVLNSGNLGNGIVAENSEIIIRNNIFSFFQLHSAIKTDTTTDCNIAYNDFYKTSRIVEVGDEGDWAVTIGPGNITKRPYFIHSFKLRYGKSPCIDAGERTQRDPDGTRINMGMYGGLESATPPLGYPMEIEYRFPKDGWYLISIPMNNISVHLCSHFPKLEEAWIWDNKEKEYDKIAEANNPNSGEWGYSDGIWLKTEADTVKVKGVPVCTYTNNIYPGWNLVGSSFYLSRIISYNKSITAQFRWDDRSYKPASSIIWSKTANWVYSTTPSDISVGETPPGNNEPEETEDEALGKPTSLTPPPPPWMSQTNIEKAKKPTEFSLEKNYPNPFNPTTNIEYNVKENARVSLKIYNLEGKLVETLIESEKPAGSYTIKWNAKALASGVYFYKLQAGNFIKVRKMTLMK